MEALKTVGEAILAVGVVIGSAIGYLTCGLLAVWHVSTWCGITFGPWFTIAHAAGVAVAVAVFLWALYTRREDIYVLGWAGSGYLAAIGAWGLGVSGFIDDIPHNLVKALFVKFIITWGAVALLFYYCKYEIKIQERRR